MVVTNPSMTGPGHITLLTGAWTGKHGIMLNNFYDRQLGFIEFFGEVPPEEQVNYLQAEPLWVPAEDAGLNTAAVHWAATAGEYEGRRVDTVVPFSSIPDHDRIEHAIQIINDNKPNLLLVYMGGVHSESYNYGPGSDEVKAKLRTIDGWIGEILDAVKEAGLWDSADFIITSDHGFTEGYSRQICPVYVLENVGIGYEFVLWGAFGHIFLSNPDQAENVKALFVGMEGVDEVYTKAEIKNLNLYNLYNENRCGDVVIVSEYGYQVAGSMWGPYENAVENVPEGRYRAGSHGYPGDLQDMWGIFLAYGAHIRKANLGEVCQVNVAPTIAAIAGFPPPEDADGEALNVLKTISTSILPSEGEGLPSEDITFLVTVKNTGSTADNYLLENVDNSGWTLELENSVLEVPAGENRTTMLTVTISENAEPGTEDSITVTATSMADNTMSDNASCVARVIPENAFTLDLVAGWNLVGFVIEDTPNNIFTGLTYYTDYFIYYWIAPGGPYGLQGPDQVLEDNLGYWIWINQNRTVWASGTPPSSRGIYLENGWNLVSFPVVNENTTPNNVFTGLTYYADYYIYYWNAPGGPYGLQGPDQVLEDDLGYWVWIDRDNVVTVP